MNTFYQVMRLQESLLPRRLSHMVGTRGPV